VSSSFRQDARYALRTMLRSPGFSAVAILTLALAAGANTAVFSVVDAVLLRPLPYPRSERLVTVWGTHRERGRYGTSLQECEDWKARNHVFQEIGVYVTRGGNLLGDPEPQRIRYAMVSPSVLRVLDVPPLLGRWFRDEENAPGNDGVAILSYHLWQGRYGGESGILGKSVLFDGSPLVVVGVMPSEFSFPERDVALWKPFGMGPEDAGERGGRWVRAVARLEDRVSVAAAGSDMASIMSTLAREYPDSNGSFTAEVEPLLTTEVGRARQALLFLLGAVGLVLLIACANVANLLLARAAQRERGEIAIRIALGASRGRIARQLLTESLVLGLLGNVAGVLLAWWGVGVLVRLAPEDLPRAQEAGVDGRVLAFTLGLTLLTSLLFGLVPAFRGAGAELSRRLNDGGRRGTSSRQRLRELLVVAEVALAVVVLVSAGLLVRSFARVLAVDPGFEPRGLLSARVEPPWRVSLTGAPEEELLSRVDADRTRAWTFYQDLVRRIASRPGVRSVGAVNTGPLTGNAWNTELAIEGRVDRADADKPAAQYRVVVPGYFETMRMPISRGRTLNEEDRKGGMLVVVVNEAFAKANFPVEDPLGHRLSIDGTTWFTIVGVVGDVADVSLESPPVPTVHVTFSQAQWGFFGSWGMDVFARTEGEPLGYAGSVRDAVREVDPSLPIAGVRDVQQFVDGTVAARRLSTTLLGLFALVALVLSIVGLYGVMTVSVGSRTKEIGIRTALGASRSELLRLVLGEGARLVATGLLVGLSGALAAGRAIESQLYAVAPGDPATFGVVALVVGAVAIAACYVPARGATRVDPMTAVRAE
jgi:putative ABC transport system permease protein